MPSPKTEISEICTGLGMLGHRTVTQAVELRPAQLLNVSDEVWHNLTAASRDAGFAGLFSAAHENGRAFLTADYGLRGRIPNRVEWKGPHRTPGYELMPIDLRVDHVFLVSCKYQSRLLFNSSPWHLFERLLAVRHGPDRGDWFLHVAGRAYERLFRRTRDSLGLHRLPGSVAQLDREGRELLKVPLRGGWPDEVGEDYLQFAEEVSKQTARLWNDRLPTLAGREEMLWRMLRISSAPYFVLGESGGRPMRFRVYTPWDWRREFALRTLNITGAVRGQPVVEWAASVFDRSASSLRTVRGHVEVRWSHGRFQGNPEAKVYLDSPHDEVPGYVQL